MKNFESLPFLVLKLKKIIQQAKKLRNNNAVDSLHPLDEHWSAEYDIKVHLEYLLQLESSYKIPSNFLDKHTEIDAEKRNTVIEWIKHMSSRFISHEVKWI